MDIVSADSLAQFSQVLSSMPVSEIQALLRDFPSDSQFIPTTQLSTGEFSAESVFRYDGEMLRCSWSSGSYTVQWSGYEHHWGASISDTHQTLGLNLHTDGLRVSVSKGSEVHVFSLYKRSRSPILFTASDCAVSLLGRVSAVGCAPGFKWR